ncbi:MAG: hypothetical protein Q9225_001491 [Loekoesia sp. 1 TL-2023]
MFLCSWSLVCMNMPGSDEGDLKVLWRKLSLTGLGILCPEINFELATGQWIWARRCKKQFNALKDERDRITTGGAHQQRDGVKATEVTLTEKRWNMKMAFFADMGGFRLLSKDGMSFPLDGKQLYYLVTHGHISEPDFDSRMIQDKNKVDALLRTITLCQISYFMVNVVGRWAQDLAVTTAELTTVSYVLCSIPTAIAWWNKPADVRMPEIIKMDKTIQDVLDADRDSKPEWIWTPLDYVNRKEWWWSLVWHCYMNFLWNLHIRFGSRSKPIDRIPDSWQRELEREHLYFLLIVSTACFSVLFVGWNYDYPTPTERILWRAACLTMMIELYVLLVIAEAAFVYNKLKNYWQSRRHRPTVNDSSTAERQSSILVHPRLPLSKRWQDFMVRVDAILEHGRNISPAPGANKDLRVHLRFIIPMWVLGIVYCLGRCYILLEDLIELRSLPVSAYQTVDWQRYWPHVGS